MRQDSVNIWFPLHTRDFIADTQGFSSDERGAYIALLTRWWLDDGTLPGNDNFLARVCGLTERQWLGMKPNLMRLFRIDGENLVSIRLEDELAKAKWNREKKRKAAQSRWRRDDQDGALP